MAFPTFTSLTRACRRPAGLALGLWLASVAVPAMAQGQPPLTAEQRKAIVDLVRETIVKNPEIIQDALVELERRNTVAQAEAQRSAVSAEKARLTDPATSVIIGNPEGDLTLVEFMDYNCGFCKRAIEDMQALTKENPDLRFVLKEFPILGPESHKASVVSMAFHKMMPGKYGQFHTALLGGEGRATEASAMKVALSLGADEKKLREAMKDPSINEAFSRTYDLANKLAISGTPSYVVGNEVVFGALGKDVLAEKIEAAKPAL